MKTYFTMATALWLSSATMHTGHAAPPQGWRLAGNAHKSYDAGVSRKIKHSGQASGYLRARSTWRKGFGTLMQSLLAEKYKGKRARLTAWVKTKDVALWAGLWMRVDGKKYKVLAFDNMQTRPIRGTTGWKQYHVVLDVSRAASGISFGVLLAGKGQLWVDDFKLEVVSKRVPLTGGSAIKRPKTPQNTSFEK